MGQGEKRRKGTGVGKIKKKGRSNENVYMRNYRRKNLINKISMGPAHSNYCNNKKNGPQGLIIPVVLSGIKVSAHTVKLKR